MITPYYENEEHGITVYCGDCLEVMKDIPDGSIDAVITDPPYGLNDGKGKVTKRGNELVEFNAGDWDNSIPKYISHAARLLKDGCWLMSFTDNLSVNDIWNEVLDAGLHPKHTVYWIKTNPVPQPRSNFVSGVETAVVATKGSVKTWNGGGWCKNWFEYPLSTSLDRFMYNHPTQKPLPLMKKLAMILSNKNDLILDPFLGSGTTAIAAYQTGRRCIGIEISEEYCDIAVRRIKEVVAQKTIALEV